MSSRGVWEVAALLVTTRPVSGKSKWLRSRATSSRCSRAGASASAPRPASSSARREQPPLQQLLADVPVVAHARRLRPSSTPVMNVRWCRAECNQSTRYTGVATKEELWWAAYRYMSEAVPRPAALVRDFVNTLDHELGTDALATRPTGWPPSSSRRVSLAEPPAVAEVRPGRGRAPAQRAPRRAGAQPRGRPGGPPGPRRGARDPAGPAGAGTAAAWWRRRPADGVDGALARIGLAAHDSVAAEVWWRLKICAFDECEWAYYDHSRNRSRSYCEYGCGNKLKTRAYRARRRAGGSAT